MSHFKCIYWPQNIIHSMAIFLIFAMSFAEEYIKLLVFFLRLSEFLVLF